MNHENFDVKQIPVKVQLGGPRLFSFATWNIAGVMAQIALLTEMLRADSEVALQLFAGGVLAYALLALWWSIIWFARKNRHSELPVSLPAAIAVMLSLVTLYFVALAVYCDAMNIATEGFTYQNIPLSVFLGTGWFASLIVFLDIRDRVAEQLMDQVQLEANQDYVSKEAAKLMSDLPLNILERMQSDLREGRVKVDEIREDFTDAHSVKAAQAGGILREIAEQNVRTLSHEIHLNLDVQKDVLRWKSIFFNTIRKGKFHPFGVSLLVFVSTFASEVRAFGVARGLSLLIAGLVVLIAIALAANRLMQQVPRLRYFTIGAAFLLMQINTLITNGIRNSWSPGYISPAYFVLQIFACALFFLTFSLFPVWRSQRLKSLQLLAQSLKDSERAGFVQKMKVAKVLQDVVHILHGKVQSQLHACAMAIEQAVVRGDTQAIVSNLAIARKILFEEVLDEMRGELPTQGAKWENEVARKIQLWEGLVSISLVTLGDEVLFDAMVAVKAGRVIEEAIANAVRHGKAHHIDIRISASRESLEIEVCDDGTPAATSDSGALATTRGVGVALISACTDGNWSLRREGNSTKLLARIPSGTREL